MINKKTQTTKEVGRIGNQMMRSIRLKYPYAEATMHTDIPIVRESNEAVIRSLHSIGRDEQE